MSEHPHAEHPCDYPLCGGRASYSGLVAETISGTRVNVVRCYCHGHQNLIPTTAELGLS